jgi:hypothetical protein
MLFQKKISRFLAGWEVDFDNKEELKRFILTQAVNEKDAKLFSEIQTSLELIIKGKNIVKVIEHCASLAPNESIFKCELPIKEWKENKIAFLIKDENGKHQIGGKRPNDFILPTNEHLKFPFTYLGFIDSSDDFFSWIGIDKLHISYPLFEGAFEIFLDYSNPSKPEMIYTPKFDYSWGDEETKGIEKIEFNTQRYSIKTDLEFDKIQDKLGEEILLTGIPMWYQYPQIPICPKSNKVMRFVTTINSDHSIKVKDKTGLENIPFSDDFLIFGDMGHMYVFFEPTSKVMCLNVQF